MSNHNDYNVGKHNSNMKTDFNLPKLRDFKIAFLNITSLPKHIDELILNMQN